MSIPHDVLAAGWIPFAVVISIIFLFSILYVYYFRSSYNPICNTTWATILGITVSLVTTTLVPVDIFLVSFMKNSDGTFKEWAVDNETRISLENGVLDAYYASYGVVMLFAFIILPFCYFYFEENDDGAATRSARCCKSICYTSAFIFVAGALLLIGAFAPINVPKYGNGTIDDIITDIISQIGDKNGEAALSFCISSLTFIGMICAIIYTAYGMSAWPMDLLKGRRSTIEEKDEIVQERTRTVDQIQIVKARYGPGARMSSRDIRQIEELEDLERYQARRERILDDRENACCSKCSVAFRPFEIVGGIFCFLMAIIVFVSLILTNIDKAMNSLGWRMGFMLKERSLPNPIDVILVYSQKVFPLDYILMTAIIFYFFFCTMGGLQHIGIWFCCKRMYKMRPRKTQAQALLFMCLFLMFIVLALNIIIYQLTPQYTTFGSQHYIIYNGTHSEVVPCTLEAPKDECTMTRISMLLTRFFYKVWFFGAAYYVLSWIFLCFMVVGFFVTLIRKRRSSVEGAIDIDDGDDDDELLLNA